jgi:hypothetical protein
MSIDLILLVAAFILGLMSAFGVPGRVTWGWLGFSLYVLTHII